MTLIPTEILTHIAQFIPHDDLCSMLNINRTFFQLAMDARYYEVSFIHFNEAELLGMQRLRDPDISYRVRYLRIDLSSQRQEYVQNNNPPAWTRRRHRTPWDEIVPAMANIISHLTNVTRFSVEWTRLPRQEELHPILILAWETFGSRLRQLAFSVPLEYLHPFLSTTDNVMALRTLDVVLHGERDFPVGLYSMVSTNALGPFVDRVACTLRNLSLTFKAPFGSWPILLSSMCNLVELRNLDMVLDQETRVLYDAEIAALTDTMARFINSVAHTLRSLSLSSCVDDLQLSPFFRQLKTIPNLESLSFFVDCDAHILSDPRGLTSFLRNHATTLRHVHWITDPVKGTSYTPSTDGRTKNRRMVDWLKENKHDGILFSNLFTLCLPVPSGIDAFALTAHYIERSAGSLESLELRELQDCYLSYDEVDALASIFASRQTEHLRELSLQVECLSPELMLLLSRKLPRLKKLSLDILYVVSQNGTEEISPATQEEELAKMRDFRDAMRKCDIRDWPLHEIKIEITKIFCLDRFDHGIGTKIMWVLAESIPSVKKFGGKDKEMYMADIDGIL